MPGNGLVVESGVFAHPERGHVLAPVWSGRSLSGMRSTRQRNSGQRSPRPICRRSFKPPPPLALIVEQVPACIAIFDADMRYLAASRRFLSMYSYVFSRRLPSPTEVVGRSHREIFPDMPSRWGEVDARVLAGEELAETGGPCTAQGWWHRLCAVVDDAVLDRPLPADVAD
jgi:PAS domain-containing protein